MLSINFLGVMSVCVFLYCGYPGIAFPSLKSTQTSFVTGIYMAHCPVGNRTFVPDLNKDSSSFSIIANQIMLSSIPVNKTVV